MSMGLFGVAVKADILPLVFIAIKPAHVPKWG